MLTRLKRELLHPGYFTPYRWFWGGSKWYRFILPNRGGFALARQRVSFLETRPGVYEFAISRGNSRRYKVYVGHSGSMRKRRQSYAMTGSHLVQLFDAVLRDGCTIWMRCKYVKSKEKAVAWEAYFLNRYDYAWNAQQNMGKRSITIVRQYVCMCMPFMGIMGTTVEGTL